MNRVFDAFFQSDGDPGGHRRWIPATDLSEEEDALVMKVDLPGLSEDVVKVEVDDNALTISGERRAEHRDREGSYFRLERGFGSFSRSYTLPKGVDPDAIEGQFDRGVLEVRIPKPEQKQPRQVQLTSDSSDSRATKVIEADGSES
jgi:HSP20 family protein